MTDSLRRWLSTLALVSFACGGGAEPAPPEPDPASERTLSEGRVVGLRNDDGAHVWRGIPTARPPIGPLRWRAPQPPESWQGLRPATSFGSACTQLSMGFGDTEAGEVEGSEDCLTANVFAPPFAPEEVPSGRSRLPVMVWIHGGGNSIGSAKLYDMGRLALSQGVIVVTVQYRLGVMGWFRHPALHATDESADDRSGNYGTLDLIRALEWVKHEIAAFGGDPDNVTVFGESAGGANVFSLLLSTRARGLFHRAIAQSGILDSREIAEAENFADDPDAPGHRYSSRELAVGLIEARTGASHEEARAALIAAKPVEVEAMLRGATTEEIYALFDAGPMGGLVEAPYVLRDGAVIPRGDPLKLFASGRANPVPVVFGSNRDESRLFLLFMDESVTRLFGVPLWLSDARRWDLLSGYMSRLWKVSGVDAPAAALARADRSRVFAYRFDWDEQPKVLFADFSVLLGASHAMEMPFMMGHLDLGRANRFLFDEERRPAAEALSEAMMSYWGQFARTGAPGRGREGTLPEWKAWRARPASAAGFLILDTEADGGIRMSSEVERIEELIAGVEQDSRFRDPRERCELFANFSAWSPSFALERYEQVAEGACQEFARTSFPNLRE